MKIEIEISEEKEAMSEKKVCENCVFCSPDYRYENEDSICRRLPPDREGWPYVQKKEDWCGEFKPIDGTEEEKP